MGGKRFRPDEKTLKQVEDLAALHLSVDAIAHIVGTSKRTLLRRYAPIIGAGRARGKGALAQKLWDKAINKDNLTAQLYLADKTLFPKDQPIDDEEEQSSEIVYETEWGGNAEPSDKEA